MELPYATYGLAGLRLLPESILWQQVLMNNSSSSFRFSSFPTSSGYIPFAQEAQDRPTRAESASSSSTTEKPAGGTPGRQRGPVAMPRRQSELLQQLQQGSSTSLHRQVHAQKSADATLSDEQVTQLNREVIATFLQKADAHEDNTQLTLDYWRDVLVEVAGWLKQQTHYPHLRSLVDLQSFLHSLAQQNMRKSSYFKHVLDLESHFAASTAAPIRSIGADNQKRLTNLIYAIYDSSLRFPRIKLPSSGLSRKEEWLLHAYVDAGLRKGTNKRALQTQVGCIGYLCQWLHKQKALQKSIPYGLDNLEKLRDHPKSQENEVNKVVEDFLNDPDTLNHTVNQVNNNATFTAIEQLREWKPQIQAPATSAATDLSAQTMLYQQPSVQPDQSASLSPPHSPDLAELGFTSSELAILNQMFPRRQDVQDDASSAVEHATAASTPGTQPHMVRRSAIELQDQSHAARPHLNPDLNFPPPEDEEFAAPVAEHAQIAPTSGTQLHGIRRPAPSSHEESRAVRPRRDNDPNSPESGEWMQYLNSEEITQHLTDWA